MPSSFNEQNVEDMVIHAIQSNGWEYIPAAELPRAESDVLVEKHLREALIRLNPCIAETPANADTVIYKLRALISTVRPHDLVTQNERFKKLIFEENSFPFDKDGRSISIKFFDYDNPENNQFVVTNQWVYPQAVGGKRLDIVLLINGFPVAIGEMKSPVRPSISWMDGAGDILDYEKSIPEMFVTNILNFATEGKSFRYGAINAPVTLWGPWYANIPHEEGDFAKVQQAVMSITKKDVILDLFRYFTLFSTDKHNRKIKVVCRYQQYEGANLIVDRVKAGYPKKGLIWHFQGSGKSLLMVFAAQKLRMVKELNAPTVIIVNDRIDLSGQIFGTFSMADVPNLVPADTNAELIRLLKADSRKVIITKIFEFDYCEVAQDKILASNQKDEIRCGDNGIFRGVPVTEEQKTLSSIARDIYEKHPFDGKYILDGGKLIVCQSNADSFDLLAECEGAYWFDTQVNPLGDWTGGTDVDTGATNRKLGSDMADSVTGGGLHGKDLSKADVSVNIYAWLKAQSDDAPVELSCAIGGTEIDGRPYSEIIRIARDYIRAVGGFEKFAEWGLV